MNNHQLKYEISKFFRNKKPSTYSYKKVIDLISKFKDTEPGYYNENMGVIFLHFDDFINAKRCLKKALEILPNKASINYKLYKLAVGEGDFLKADLELCNYENKLNKANIKYDISLPLTMLETYINLSYGAELDNTQSKKIEKTNHFGVVEIRDGEIEEKIHIIIEQFNKKDYRGTLGHIENIIDLINQKNYPIEFDTIKIIMQKIVKEYNKIVKNNFLTNEEIRLNLSSEKYIDLVDFNDNKQVKIMLNDINKILKENPKKAKCLLDKLKSNVYYNKYKLGITMLYNTIKETNEVEELDNEKKQIFYNIKECASKEYKEGNYINAYDYYLAGKYITENNIFNYYIGKMLFKTENFTDAYNYFSEYKKKGGEKLSKCLLYMTEINFRRKKYKCAQKYKNELNKINRTFNSEFNYGINYMTIIDDKRNRALIRKINLSENDFVQEKILPREDYDKYNIEDKLNIIKSLFKNRQIKEAEKLLNNLKPKNNIEKTYILQFQKNKTLYKNQNR